VAFFAVEEVVSGGCCGANTEEKRVLRTVTLDFHDEEKAARWRSLLLWTANTQEPKFENEPHKRKALLLLNPFGGAGAADRNWELQAK